MTPEQADLVRYRLARAREAMAEARLLLDGGHCNACVNRLYYACFYAVSALLLLEGCASAKHTGVRALFERHFVKTGRISVDLGRTYRRLFTRRQRGDYDDFVQFKEDEVRTWLRDAEGFVSALTQTAEAQLPPKEPIPGEG
jgi:uncharacterized protein (UPF0332 family)